METHKMTVDWSRLMVLPDAAALRAARDDVAAKLREHEQRIARMKLDEAWATAVSDFAAGTVVDARVVKLSESGADVELTPYIRGLVPTHELAEPAPLHAEEVVEVGETLRCVVLNIYPSARLILLVSKRALDKRESAAEVAWREAGRRHEIGCAVIGRVSGFTESAVQVSLNRYVVGIVPMTQLTGMFGRPTVQIGDEVSCVVVRIDAATRELALMVGRLARNTLNEDRP